MVIQIMNEVTNGNSWKKTFTVNIKQKSDTTTKKK